MGSQHKQLAQDYYPPPGRSGENSKIGAEGARLRFQLIGSCIHACMHAFICLFLKLCSFPKEEQAS